MERKMTKMQWLRRLRCLTEVDSLEKIIEKKKYELSDEELAVFWGAADHRLAEILMNRLYDHVSPTVWKLVR